MQLTIEIPDELARQVEPERGRLAEIIARALRPKSAAASGLRREVLAFLARGPQPGEIVAFRPSESGAERIRTLLGRSKAGALTPEEEGEMDDIGDVDLMVSELKALARLHLQGAA